MGRAVIINLKDEELEKLGKIFDINIDNDNDIEFAIGIIIENLEGGDE